MAEHVRVDSIETDSKFRVAFDLMEEIARHESEDEVGGKNRRYWLTLYANCLQVVNHGNPESVKPPLK